MLYSASIERLFELLKLLLGVSAVLVVACSQGFRSFLRALYEAEQAVAKPLSRLMRERRAARTRVVKKICWRSRALCHSKRSTAKSPISPLPSRGHLPALVTPA